jgi:hypothetical protein
VTHPEAFVRARALELWAASPDATEGELGAIIEGHVALAELDLLGQEAVSGLTRRLIAALLRPAWLRTEAVLAHARLFFEDLEPADAEDPALAAELAGGDEKLLDYWCYVILDFAAADRDLEDASLAAALLFADGHGLGDRFRRIALKELGLKRSRFEALEAGAAATVARAAAGDA